MQRKYWGKVFVSVLVIGFVLQLVIFLIVLFSFASILLQLIGHPLASPVSFVLVTAVLLSMFFKLFKKGKLNELYTETDYQLRRTEKPTTDLKPYETDFLSALFKLQVASSAALESVRDNGSEKSPLSREVFSTLLMQQDPTASRALYMRMQEIEKNLYGEVEQETDAFSRGRAKWAKASFISIFLVIAGIQFGAGTITLLTSSQPGVLVLCLIVTAVIVTIAWFSPRLNQKGELLKEEWLGFKMYLETAERYRMQNLTPDTFEKYLPYAMIFGIEKKWAKAFEGMTMTPPTWYSSGTAVGVGVYAGTVSSPSFSPSSFASGFSTSFASSFASSGGSGSSGGGGGGGGGSGGGGGGGGGGGAG